MLDSFFKSCDFSTKDIHSNSAVSVFLRKGLKLSTGGSSVKNMSFLKPWKSHFTRGQQGLLGFVVCKIPPKYCL